MVFPLLPSPLVAAASLFLFPLMTVLSPLASQAFFLTTMGGICDAGLREILLSPPTVQGSEIRYADSTKQVPIRARQNRQARAGTNFTKPRTSLFSEVCTYNI